ncbi:hypothetical protein U27_03087 [Candidatus Vecturithrix granuli]|uniref:TIR domain-containing protein n=1 Tax=Vecturithrix granuli TaxID=1499967 RepID=A0A081BUX0_VECG1|nr:hypothetical protein U27_03087 [Candidatus Vecturithrix granuli]
MHSIFLSYSTKDVEFAQKLKETLKEREVDVEIDSEKIESGDNVETKIREAIEGMNVSITIVSQESLASTSVIWEFVETLKFQEVIGREKFIPISLDKFGFEMENTGIVAVVGLIEEFEQAGIHLHTILQSHQPAVFFNAAIFADAQEDQAVNRALHRKIEFAPGHTRITQGNIPR